MTEPAQPGTPVTLVDDDAEVRGALSQLLGLSGYAVNAFAAAAPALDALDADYAGVVVTDVRMPGLSGIELFRALHARDRDLPVILVTGHGDIGMAVDAIRQGAWDFLAKPFDPDALLAAVGRAAVARAAIMQNRALLGERRGAPVDRLLGRSEAMRRLRATLPVIAQTELDVLIEGETGTGKRLVARIVHDSGRRARWPFVALDCGALPVAMLERELFSGFGLIARSHRGTLFLDNLDRADADVQRRLATFAEGRTVNLQAREPEPVDTRIVAAIDEAARDRVLPALYHRLAAVTVRVPPLAERHDDVAPLLAHFAELAAEQHRRPVPPIASAAHLLSRRVWPGNVRELEMAAERFVLGLEGTALAEPERSLNDRLRAFERAAILDAWDRAGCDVGDTIRLLQMPRETFYYRVKRLGIDLKAMRREKG